MDSDTKAMLIVLTLLLVGILCVLCIALLANNHGSSIIAHSPSIQSIASSYNQ